VNYSTFGDKPLRFPIPNGVVAPDPPAVGISTGVSIWAEMLRGDGLSVNGY